MSCEACQEMQVAVSVKPHEWLRANRNASKLRPLRGRPLVLQRYRCTRCDTNWVHELDLLDPTQDSWICLYHASSILDPTSVSCQDSSDFVSTPKSERDKQFAESTPLTHQFT